MKHSRNTKHIKRQSTKQKYNTPLCDDKMSFEDCELAILRNAVDETDILQKQKIANSDDVKQMIQILENFLIDDGSDNYIVDIQKFKMLLPKTWHIDDRYIKRLVFTI
jgi:hypothetical protein